MNWQQLRDDRCGIDDDIAKKRLESLLWDVERTVEGNGSDEEFTMLQEKVGWAVMHIMRFHPGLRIRVIQASSHPTGGKTPPGGR